MSKTIQAILDDDDFAAVTARAKALSIGVSAYVRMRLHLMLALPEAVSPGDAFDAGWNARHARAVADDADTLWPEVTAARKADRKRWEGDAK